MLFLFGEGKKCRNTWGAGKGWLESREVSGAGALERVAAGSAGKGGDVDLQAAFASGSGKRSR